MTSDVYGIVPSGGSVYWSSQDCQGIRKSPSNGGTPATLIPRVSSALMGVNATHLYFAPNNTQVLSGPL